MGVVLYRKGNTHVNRGVKCEACVFPVERMQSNLNAGWVTDPRKLYEVEDAVSESEQSEQTESQENSEASSQEESDKVENKEILSNKEIREQAKVANIEGWKTLRIETLKEKLGYDQS